MPFYNKIPVLGKYLYSNSRTQLFTPEKQKELLHEYHEAIGLQEFNDTMLEKLVRRKDLSGFFLKTEDKDLQSLKTKLSLDTDSTKIVKKAISEALNLGDSFKEAAANYKESVGLLNELQKQIPNSYKPQDLVATFTKLNEEALPGIKVQQANEVTQLQAKLAEPDVTKALAEALNLNPENQASKEKIDEAKQALVNDLKVGHSKQLALFNKNSEDSVTNLHQAAAKASTELLFIANLRKNGPAMRDAIDKLAEKNRNKDGGNDPSAQVEYGEDNKVLLKNVHLKDIPIITTITGRKITRTEGKDKDGNPTISYQLELPGKYSSFFLNKLYNTDPRQNPKSDMITLAQAIRASGHESIEMNLKFDDPERAMERGRQAYQACIEAGFPPDKIDIVVNGQKYTHSSKNDKGTEVNTVASELFKGHGQEYSQTIARSDKIKTGLAEISSEVESKIKGEGEAKTKEEMKTKLAELREAAQRREPVAEHHQNDQAPSP